MAKKTTTEEKKPELPAEYKPLENLIVKAIKDIKGHLESAILLLNVLPTQSANEARKEIKTLIPAFGIEHSPDNTIALATLPTLTEDAKAKIRLYLKEAHTKGEISDHLGQLYSDLSKWLKGEVDAGRFKKSGEKRNTTYQVKS
jgi:hypothetical protein